MIVPVAIAWGAVWTVAVVAALAFAVLVIIDRWQRAIERRDAEAGDLPLPDLAPFRPLADDHLLAKADGGLLNADDERLVRAAAVLDERDHPKALPYLLHALRRAPEHRDALLELLVRYPREDVRRHGDLVRALPPRTREVLRDRLGENTASR